MSEQSKLEPADVVRLIGSRTHLYGETQAQKLAYYAQAWSLVWSGRPLFQESLEAWTLGPVAPSLRHRRLTGAPDLSKFTESQVGTVLAVGKYYGPMNGGELVDLTHKELPWQQTWNGRTTDHDTIQLDVMLKFYTRMSISGKGPMRPPGEVRYITGERAERIAAETSKTWSQTLARLAE